MKVPLSQLKSDIEGLKFSTIPVEPQISLLKQLQLAVSRPTRIIYRFLRTIYRFCRDRFRQESD
jgi:hypothetical protein